MFFIHFIEVLTRPFLLLLPMFLLFICSCGDTVVENAANSNGSISVIVVDAVTNLSLKNANIQLLGKDEKPRNADSKGGVIYENLPIGKGYIFYIEAPGYASAMCKADISADGEKDILIIDDTILEVRLPKLGAKLQGNIAYMDFSTNDFNIQAAGNGEAKVRLRLSMSNECELLNPYKETTTGLNGSYLFDNLPEFAIYELTALEAKIDGIAYKQFLVQRGVLGLFGDIAKVPLGIYKEVVLQEEFRLLSAPDTVAPNGKISLLFSNDINKSRINGNAFSIIGVSYALETKWNGERILEISPIGGIWKIDDVINIANIANLYAMDGSVLTPRDLATVTVTNGALEAVPKFWLENTETGTALNVAGDSLDLAQNQGIVFRWNKAGNATSYAIYAKCAREINYTRITTGLSISDTSATWGYSQVHYCVEQNKQASFFVQARNAREHTNSEIVSVTGYVKPKPEEPSLSD
jgi:hypothetical protein